MAKATIVATPELKEAAMDLAELLITDGGMSPERAAQAIGDVTDALIDWTEVVPGPAGYVLEAGDARAAAALVSVIAAAITPDPATKRARLLRKAKAAEDRGRTRRAINLRKRAKAIKG